MVADEELPVMPLLHARIFWSTKKKILCAILVILLLLILGGVSWVLDCDQDAPSCTKHKVVSKIHKKKTAPSNVFLDTYKRFFGEGTDC